MGGGRNRLIIDVAAEAADGFWVGKSPAAAAAAAAAILAAALPPPPWWGPSKNRDIEEGLEDE